MTLTQTKADEMESGIELDALVAERVMGWSDFRPLTHPELKGRVVGRSPDGSQGMPPPYSTDLNTAWKVVEKLCEGDKRDVSLGWFRVASCAFNGKNGPGECVFASTPALAICRAALKLAKEWR